MKPQFSFGRFAPSVFMLAVLAAAAAAQIGVRGQIFLPNGAPVQRPIRFTLTADNGTRADYFFTDSNGRISMPRVASRYTITVESDGELYDTTSASFDPIHAGNYIIVNLKPLKNAPPPAPGLIDAGAVDTNVSQKAKEAYDSAIKLLQAEQYEQAVGPLKQAISAEPNYFHAHNDLGVLYMKLNKLDEAATELRQAIKINDKVYLPQLNLGIVLNRQGKFKEAAEVLIKVRQTHPDLVKVHMPLVEALIGAGDWARAEEAINSTLSIKEVDVVDLKTKLGVVLIRQAKFSEAASVLGEAAAAEPANALAQFNLGAALQQTGRLDEAEAALARAYQIEGPRMAGAQLLLGEVYFQKKNYAKAVGAFENYLRDLPDAPNAAQVKEAIKKLRQALSQK